jgi:hypothetical protein
MALRAQRKRQGGSSRGGGRPSVVVGQPGAGATLRPPVPKKPPIKGQGQSILLPTRTPPGPNVPGGSPTYVKKAAPLPSAPVRTAGSEALRADATSTLGIARNQNRDAIFRAVMQLGDPSLIAKYQQDPTFSGYQFAQDPNSVFASLARQETQGLEDIDVGANAGNTFFSGQRLKNRQELTDETGRQRLAGSTSFEDDLRNYAASLGLSESGYRQSMADADQMDIDAALEQDRLAAEKDPQMILPPPAPMSYLDKAKAYAAARALPKPKPPKPPIKGQAPKKPPKKGKK